MRARRIRYLAEPPFRAKLTNCKLHNPRGQEPAKSIRFRTIADCRPMVCGDFVLARPKCMGEGRVRHTSVNAAREHRFAGDPRVVREKLHGLLQQLDAMAGPLPATGVAATPERIRAILKARRARSQFFPSEFFAEPAWDILLDLYAADVGQYRTTVGDLGVGANLPATTALRWIKILEKRGILQRRGDPRDGRRVFAELTDEGRRAMDSLFLALPPTELVL